MIWLGASDRDPWPLPAGAADVATAENAELLRLVAAQTLTADRLSSPSVSHPVIRCAGGSSDLGPAR